MNVAILIPAYNPDEHLISFVGELCTSGISKIIVVNDGSNKEKEFIFETVQKFGQVTVLQHAVNLGKGAALKTGFNYFCCNCPGYSGIVTADADGQHLVKNVLENAEILSRDSSKLVLGFRKFERNIPFRSLLGNVLTKCIFRFFSGIKVSDTQTGLRGIPRDFILKLLKINSNGYEYEMEMLLRAKSLNVGITEHPIETVYIDDNQSSHFNPLIDSMKIYFVLFRFVSSSFIAAILDYVIFVITYFLTKDIVTSLCMAHPFSIVVNFLMNKKFVFHFEKNLSQILPKFIILVIVFRLIAYGLIELFANVLDIEVVIAKILAEGVLYFPSFTLQRDFIFCEDAGRE